MARISIRSQIANQLMESENTGQLLRANATNSFDSASDLLTASAQVLSQSAHGNFGWIGNNLTHRNLSLLIGSAELRSMISQQ